MSKSLLSMFVAVLALSAVGAGETVKLPPPQMEGGMGFFTALAQRRSQLPLATLVHCCSLSCEH